MPQLNKKGIIQGNVKIFKKKHNTITLIIYRFADLLEIKQSEASISKNNGIITYSISTQHNTDYCNQYSTASQVTLNGDCF